MADSPEVMPAASAAPEPARDEFDIEIVSDDSELLDHPVIGAA